MKFSFVKANAIKIALLPAYALVGLLARLAPRNNKLWVFGRRAGFGEGPLRVLETARARRPDLRLVWLAQDAHDMKLASDAGVTCVPRASWRGLLVTIRASAIIITHGLGDVCRPAAPGARIVQLWHGTPLKLISLDSPSTYRVSGGLLGRLAGACMRRVYEAAFRMPSWYVVPSDLCASRFRSAFALSRRKILKIGDPRCDCLQVPDLSRARCLARRRLRELWAEPGSPSRLLLYAPTWRDGEPDPAAPGGAELAELARACDRLDAWVVIRSHPWGYGLDSGGAERWPDCIKFLPSSLAGDITPLLHAFDGLVTDYSAIAIDYALLERPIYFLAADLADYASSRGLYEPYERFTEGDWSSGWPEVIAAILEDATHASSHQRRCDRTRRLKQRHHDFFDGEAAVRLVSLLGAAR